MPRLSARLAESGAEIWRSTALGLADYWVGACLRGRADPLSVAADASRWLSLALPQGPPRWHTPHTVAFETPIARLRDFTPAGARDVVPTLVLPPQAGHDSSIVDFSPRRSQLAAIRAAGLERVFALDYVGATQATKDASAEDFLAVIERAVDEIGEPVNLIGDSQGGWIGAVYAALRPEHVNTLSLAGAPVDPQAGDAVIADWVRALTSDDLAFYRGVVEQGGGVLRGEHVRKGLILIRPEEEVAKQLELLSNLHDEEFVERHVAFETWFQHPQDVPGAFYLWIVEHHFVHNRLVRGELEIGGERVDLARIACPVNLLAGAKDHITPPEQVFALGAHVSTPPAEIRRHLAPSSHLGLFTGTAALRDHWPALLADVAAHSGAATT